MFEKLKQKLFEEKVKQLKKNLDEKEKKIIEDSGIVISKEEADKMREQTIETDLKLTEIDIFYNSMREVFYKYQNKENESLLTDLFWDLDKEVEKLKRKIK